jgi:3-phosphoglycerate kinase
MHQVKKISDETDLKGKYVLLRSSLNVPVKDGQVVNQFRIVRAVPTIKHLLDQGARVILIGHIGRDPKETLKPVADVLGEMFPVIWAGLLKGDVVDRMRLELKDGEILMLENLRSDERETENNPAFASELAAMADIYVDDAFAAAHREHASVVGVPALIPGYVGINFCMEYEELKRTLKPEHPSLFILGGAKFETKMPLVKKFLNSYDHIFIGGALANDFFKAKGFEVGKSLVSDIDLSDSDFLNNEKIIIPVDVVVDGPDGKRTVAPDEVTAEETILDAGPETIKLLSLYTRGAKTILWNGPLGNYEEGFADGTESLAKLVAESGAYSVVGGGDTVAAIESLGLSGQFGFMSTGGGAMLEFLEHGTLVAIDALKVGVNQ